MTTGDNTIFADYSKFLDDSREHLTYAALSTYRNFAYDLSQKEKHFFKTHLTACAACAARLKEVDDLEFGEGRKKTALIIGISPAIFRYAIAAILIMTVGMSVLLVLNNVQGKKNASQNVGLDKQIVVTIPDKENFAPNQTLESFIGRTVRSVQKVTLLVPAVGDTVSTPFIITWKGSNEKFTLTVVNNKNTEMWKKTTRSSEIEFTDTLQAGLYYLKLEVNEKLALIGKFVVVH